MVSHECHGGSSHSQIDCLFDSLFKLTTKYQSSASLALCVGEFTVTGGLLSPMVSNAESISTSWRHHLRGASHIHTWAYSFNSSGSFDFGTMAIPRSTRWRNRTWDDNNNDYNNNDDNNKNKTKKNKNKQNMKRKDNNNNYNNNKKDRFNTETLRIIRGNNNNNYNNNKKNRFNTETLRAIRGNKFSVASEAARGLVLGISWWRHQI